MHQPSTTRRRLLQTGAALGATALAGCFGDGGDDGNATVQPRAVVPGGSQYAGFADVSALLDDQALRTSANDLFETLGDAGAMAGSGPSSVTDALDQVEESVGLDPREISGVAGFGTYEGAGGGVVWTDWSLDDLRSALNDSGVEPGTESYNDHDVLVTNDGIVAELADGTFAVGQRTQVETVVDVTAGDASAVGGVVESGLDATGEGAMRLAFEPPADFGSGEATVGGVDPTVFEPITHGYGAYVIDGSDRRSYLTLATETGDDASALRGALETLLAQARQQLANARAPNPMVAEVRPVLEAASVSTDGAAVTLATTDAEGVPMVFVAVVSSFVLGLGSSSGPVAPQIAFEFSYDAEANVVTVTHTGGDHARADALFVRGQGIGGSSGADMTAAGPWAGSTSSDLDGAPAVSAGDSVTVGVTGPDYALRVVWESPDGGTSATLAMHRGPEA